MITGAARRIETLFLRRSTIREIARVECRAPA